MMMTIVDAVALLNNVDSWELDRYSKQYVKKMLKSMKIEGIERIRHGYWLYDRLCSTNGGTYGVQRCSNCGYYYKDFGDEWNYCPHCGAKMDEVEE